MVSALGLDLGARRIGVAGCDRTGLVATGITTLYRTTFESIVEPLKKIVADRNVEILVVGLPYTLDGEIGNQAKKTQKQAHKLSKALNLPVEFVDERLTSFAAEQMIIDANGSALERHGSKRHGSKHHGIKSTGRLKNKGLIDRKAAAIILQQWLDARDQKSDLLTI
ncbi:MAG: Holliday junction resolvase RuvX [Cyanobacteria bacterium P01_D01_bin.105]